LLYGWERKKVDTGKSLINNPQTTNKKQRTKNPSEIARTSHFTTQTTKNNKQQTKNKEQKTKNKKQTYPSKPVSEQSTNFAFFHEKQSKTKQIN
jgi:hypothetical protein